MTEIDLFITNVNDYFIFAKGLFLITTGIGICFGLVFHGFKIIEVNTNSKNVTTNESESSGLINMILDSMNKKKKKRKKK